MKKYCSYCKQNIEFSSHHKWMAHRRNCVYNPNLNKIFDKIRKGNEKTLGTKYYKFSCRNCGETYILKLTKNRYISGNYKKYCSQKCANQKPDKSRSYKKLKTFLEKGIIKQRYRFALICKECGKEFIEVTIDTKPKRMFCSISCSRKHGNPISEETKEKIRGTNKLRYKNGRKMSGGFASWYKYKNIRVHGTYELRTCKILDRWKESEKIKDWEYTKDHIQYIGLDGIEHTYYMDFKIFKMDGSIYYIETKGYKNGTDELKWKTAKDKGLVLEVWFGDDIRKTEEVMGII